jgi:hypothetical protein
MIIMNVSQMEGAPDFRTLKYDWSLPDFWKLKFMLESKSKINSARIDDEHEKLLRQQAGK